MSPLAAGFSPYATDHLVVLILTAVGIAGFTLLARRAGRWRNGQVVRAAMCYSLTAVLLLNAAATKAREVISGEFDVRRSLPLHLCEIGIFVTAAALIAVGNSVRRRVGVRGEPAAPRATVSVSAQRLYELSYYWGVGGAVQALLTPEIDAHFPSPRFVSFFVMHAVLLIAPLMMTLGLRMQPGRRSFGRVWCVTNALTVCVILVNAALGSNYMYLCGPPAAASLYDYFGPWPWSLLTLEAVGTVVFASCYAPFWFARRARAPDDEANRSEHGARAV